MASFLPLLVLGAAGFALWSKTQSGAAPGDTATPGAPMPLRAQVPYLFIVRLETTDEAAAAVLESKGVDSLEFGPASAPPFWAKPGETYSTRIASFKATPNGNGSVTLGDPFYGIGRLNTLVRLDGQPFTAEAPSV